MKRISDYYHPEICERIRELPHRGDASERQKRLIDIVEDDAVMSAAKHVLDTVLEHESLTSATAREAVENFWIFLEDAAALPDIRPRGAHYFAPGNDAGFFTPAEIRKELDILKDQCDCLVKHLELRRELILSDKLDPLLTLLKEFGASEHLNEPNNSAFPQFGRAAGKNNWRNDMLQGLFMRAEARLGNQFPEFCREIHRVLMDLEIPVDKRTAHDLQGAKTKLTTSF